MLFREVEGPLRAWLKAHPSIAPLTGGGRYVYFAAPDVREKPAAWLTFRRIGGGPEVSETPIDAPLVSFNCWGRTKSAADTLAEALVNALQDVRQPTPMGEIVAMSARVTLWTFQPDPSLATPRVVVDAAMQFRVASLT